MAELVYKDVTDMGAETTEIYFSLLWRLKSTITLLIVCILIEDAMKSFILRFFFGLLVVSFVFHYPIHIIAWFQTSSFISTLIVLD